MSVSPTSLPRLVIAGTAGDSGKTLAALSLTAAWRARGLSPVCFKKGPDFIDAAWLTWAAGVPCRNLDTFLQPREEILDRFLEHASPRINVIEGNRGLHDGFDVDGTHSTAVLARLLGAPVILVVNAAKVTRTAAAVVLGCLQLPPKVDLAGVILNRVAGPRHEGTVRRAVEELAGVEVVGCIPRIKTDLLPDRHLGLIPPQEHQGIEALGGVLGDVAEKYLDLERLQQLATGASALESGGRAVSGALGASGGPRIGVFTDTAFTFYYPENLEALEREGAELVHLSGLSDRRLPRRLDGLYLGGGFPESHVRELAANTELHGHLRRAAAAGMPIYAECGGMVFLSRSLTCGGERSPMAGVLPVHLKLFSRPQGHGYVSLEVDRSNPFFDVGTRLRGHEFHYTKIHEIDEELSTAFDIQRGTGAVDGRDGVVYKNVLAGYTHLHASGVTEWAPAFVRRAREHRVAVHDQKE